MADTTGTPLTRYGRRVPITPTPTTSSTPNQTDHRVQTNADTALSGIELPPTIRTMIVCVSDEMPGDALACGQLDRHLSVKGMLSPRFWASPALRPWQRARMFDLRKGRPAYCAGGPIRHLNLAGMRYAASVGAGVRHQRWSTAVHGTRPANPWSVYHQRHQADPSKYPMRLARADYDRQPRILAMRMHNAVNPTAGQFDLDELEIYQAGFHAYQQYSAATAVAADALLTQDGTRLAPAAGSFAARVSYLHKAMSYIDSLTGSLRLLAIAI
jgi:hypothetical protein